MEIADRLGHESVRTTLDTYSHLYPDKDQQLADRLNQFRRAVPPELYQNCFMCQNYTVLTLQPYANIRCAI